MWRWKLRIPFTIRKRGGRKQVITPDGVAGWVSPRARIDNTMIKAIARGFRWRKLLETGVYGTLEAIVEQLTTMAGSEVTLRLEIEAEVPSGLGRVAHPGICQLLSQRLSELQLTENEVLSDIGQFIIVEPGDTIGSLEEASGCVITTDLFGDNRFGDSDFVPNHEWLEYHQNEHCYWNA